ncbi:MAG TPA: nitroreductase family protein [Rectinema sp.]|nr:nitroreductase family protein [Rectinema sp.]
MNGKEYSGLQRSSTDLLEIIFSRRSIRKYKDKEIPEEFLETLIKTGCCAPSAVNRHPCHFVIVRDKETLKAIASIACYDRMIASASACIVICGDKAIQGTEEFLIEDCAAATENILLAAHGIGLGGVWCGVLQRSALHEHLVKALALPNKVIPLAIIALGFPDESPPLKERYDPQKVHWEKW